jgi:ribonuclease J
MEAMNNNRPFNGGGFSRSPMGRGAGRPGRGRARGPMHQAPADTAGTTGTSDLHEIGKNPAPTSLPLKEGFKREESPRHNGARRGKMDRGGHGGAFAIAPRMSTFKNKPFHKTGTDDHTLNGNQRLKVIVLGGNEEVGRNCTLLEYGNDIIMIDCGLQFPDEDMPGVDYIIPNISYLKGKEKNVRAVIITHAHYDHIGGIPHIVPRIGNPPVFATDLTCGIISKRQQDHRDAPPLKLNTIKTDDVLQLGAFTVEFFGVAHSMAASTGVIVHTPAGIIVHTGDFKLETGPNAQSLQETEKIKALGEKNVLALMIDSTNASQPGRQIGETEIQHNIDEIISSAKGRIIIGTFASMISRIQQIIQACERNGRKVAVEGFSMRSNIAIAQELGYMHITKGTLIDTKQIHDYPANNVAVICTGAQGESRAALMRMANREHPIINIQPGDTVVFSSSVIPGNERTVQRVKDILCREGADVIHYKMMDVHAGGHAKQEDLQEMHAWVKPKYLVPIEGHYSFLVDHAKAAVAGGFPRERIFIADNGQVMEFDGSANGVLTNHKVPTEFVFVDGLGVGDVSQVVLRDRQELAGDGIVIIVAVIEHRTGKLLALPDIISRGFVYMKEQQELIQNARRVSAGVLKDRDANTPADPSHLKEKLRDEMGEFFYKKTERRPMILPVIVEV